MKRVKLMLSAILVMAVVSAGLAFKVKAPLRCAYVTTNSADADACPRVSQFCVNSKTIAGSAFASTIACNEPCPETTVCLEDRTLTAQED